MKFNRVLLIAAIAASMCAQQVPPGIAAPKPVPAQPLPELPPNTVVLTFDGKGYTAEEVRAMLGGLPPQAMQGIQPTCR